MTMMTNDSMGVDISKDFLDLHRQLDGSAARFRNTPAGFHALLIWLGKDVPRLVVFEATGPYHMGALSERFRGSFPW